MLLRFLGSRGFMSVAGALAIGVLVVVGYVVAFQPFKKTETYCALMPDTIGLYVGNHVTMRGMPVGEVTAITPSPEHVRVEFTVDAAYSLPAAASATTVSDTVVADRDLALVNVDPSEQLRDPAECITKTLTPKSLTETLGALAELSSELLGPQDSEQNALARGIGALNSATAGTGPQLNEIIRKLGTALHSPDAAIGHLAGLLDSLAALSSTVAGRWGDIKSMMLRLSDVLDNVNNELFNRTVEIIDSFQKLLPMLNDITTLFGDPILDVLDAAVPLVRLLGDNVDALRDIITKIPALTGAFTTVAGPGAPGLTYAPPRVALPEQDANQMCALINAVSPGRCAPGADGRPQVDLAQWVLAMTGAR
ncbi:MCE family protein [Nocardia puris]|uniref:Virulence factor Mce-like protein n=2 Tax=Nocardia puris TaxID=208602 RepID=A0A366DVP1_9NOCA|nr:MCE family protein [Nocardia puris]MBF6367250.1 MCE family protein [Nocardia puris]MBF6457434.1 MCE family protein [Nocardia puris]RBO93589.1 virulence factor Mce-like protein [Nocardia puris]